MKSETVFSGIGFSDAELVAYRKSSDTFIVEVMAWNESSLTIVFNDVIRILDNDTSSISSFCKLSDSEFLDAALSRLYDAAPPKHHPYVHYQFLDADESHALEIVSIQMDIVYS